MFTASCDKTAKMWDLNSNQAIQIAQVRRPHPPHTAAARRQPSVLEARAGGPEWAGSPFRAGAARASCAFSP